jgi:hypothetical protein
MGRSHKLRHTSGGESRGEESHGLPRGGNSARNLHLF